MHTQYSTAQTVQYTVHTVQYSTQHTTLYSNIVYSTAKSKTVKKLNISSAPFYNSTNDVLINQ